MRESTPSPALFDIPDLRQSQCPEQTIEAFLRAKITSGDYPEGMLLPSTLPWARALGFNNRRLQRVLSQLAAQGFLERRPRLGTRVKRRVGRPTVVILCGFALVEEQHHYFRRVIEQLMLQLRQREYEVEVIDDLFSLLINDIFEQQRRVTKLRERLAAAAPVGYVECSFDLSRLPDLYPAFRRPLVSLYATAGGGDVSIDERAIVRESMKYLASKGRRKVLLLRSAGRLGPLHWTTKTFWSAVETYGFLRGSFREVYHSGITNSIEDEAYRWTLQLVKSWETLRRNYVPDSLLVCDDIMMRGVAKALAEAKVRVPKDLLVVCSASTGIRLPYPVPVIRCEAPIPEVAHRLVELLDDRIKKRKPTARPPLLVTTTRIDENN